MLGYHPWFSHWISLESCESKEEHYRHIFKDADEHPEAFQKLLAHLPEPVALRTVLEDVRQNLMAFPRAMLGEVGIDRAFRVPYDFSSPRELTPFTTPFEHQLAILEAQLDLAAELGRNISMHSVKSQQATVELFDRMVEKHGERWTKISLDIHSCSLSPQTWLHIEVRLPDSDLTCMRFILLQTALSVDLNESFSESSFKRIFVSFNSCQWSLPEPSSINSCMFS
jgi:Tat protein secretion system quality control protein TatD with DNase activity